MSDLTLLVLLKIAYLVSGLILCLVGKGLIEKKLRANFEGEGSIGESSFKVVSTSPGLIFLTAGFLAIAAAIFQEFKIVDSDIETMVETGTDSMNEGEKITTLVKSIREIRFADADHTEPSLDAAIDLASAYAAAGNIEESAVYVAIAIVTSPATLARFYEDKIFEPVLNNPQLQRIIQSRFALPMSMPEIPGNQLSTLAEQNLAMLQSLARLEAPTDDQISLAWNKSESIPNNPGQQSEVQIFALLEQLLALSSNVLHTELVKPGRRWILHNEQLMLRLEIAIDTKMRNG